MKTFTPKPGKVFAVLVREDLYVPKGNYLLIEEGDTISYLSAELFERIYLPAQDQHRLLPAPAAKAAKPTAKPIPGLNLPLAPKPGSKHSAPKPNIVNGEITVEGATRTIREGSNRAAVFEIVLGLSDWATPDEIEPLVPVPCRKFLRHTLDYLALHGFIAKMKAHGRILKFKSKDQTSG